MVLAQELTQTALQAIALASFKQIDMAIHFVIGSVGPCHQLRGSWYQKERKIDIAARTSPGKDSLIFSLANLATSSSHFDFQNLLNPVSWLKAQAKLCLFGLLRVSPKPPG